MRPLDDYRILKLKQEEEYRRHGAYCADHSGKMTKIFW
jgi:hypothetical protein